MARGMPEIAKAIAESAARGKGNVGVCRKPGATEAYVVLAGAPSSVVIQGGRGYMVTLGLDRERLVELHAEIGELLAAPAGTPGGPAAG